MFIINTHCTVQRCIFDNTLTLKSHRVTLGKCPDSVHSLPFIISWRIPTPQNVYCGPKNAFNTMNWKITFTTYNNFVNKYKNVK